MRGLSIVCFILLLAACGETARTEIIVAVDSDFTVPTEIDGVRIDMVGPEGQLRRSMGPLIDQGSLPATVGMVHTTGPLGPVQVTVTGTLAGGDFIQRRANVSFVEGETLVLFVELLRECVDVSCSPGMTCARGGCRAIDVDRSELASWTGSFDRDGGVDAGCEASIELCNGADDDCDGASDEDFDLQSDVDNCGACDVACPDPLNGSPSCAAGSCGATCDPGWDDCDADPASGCEASLSTPESCGDCATMCDETAPFCQETTPDSGTFGCVATCMAGLTECGGACVDTGTSPQHCGVCNNACLTAPNASPSCVASSCDIDCDDGFDNCNATMDDGCETAIDTVMNCGSCGNACSFPNGMPACNAAGSCELAGCTPPFDDCDMDAATGCEVDVSSSAEHCGTCGSVCMGMVANGNRACMMGGCDVACDPGFGDCDMDPGTGCEIPVNTAMQCGSCGVSCSGAFPTCSGSPGSGYMCTEDCSAPNTLCGTACTDTTSDPMNCGTCTMACTMAPAGASPACISSSCGFVCDASLGDCDGDPGNGCEASLMSATDCGACGVACAPANATGSCGGAGSCTIASCDAGWDDCDMMAATGCELDVTTISDCGSCGNACPTGVPNSTATNCTGGTCTLTCVGGFGNCDGDPGNGCETPLDTLTDCGSCGTACSGANATTECSTGTCQITACDANFDDCNGSVPDGCETNLLTSRANCGMCGNRCIGAMNRCCSGTCMSASMCP